MCLGLFLADAVVSLADDSLILMLDVHLLSLPRGILVLFTVLVSLAVYVLMGITPMIPKSVFLPLTIFNPVATLITLPVLIYYFSRTQHLAWALSLYQVAFALWILYRLQGGFHFRWPLVTEDQLAPHRFSWLRLSVFLAVNFLIAVPAVIIYVVICSALAVDHFSDGFLSLRPEGLTVQVRKYTRSDGKTVQLYPMSHVGEFDFYRKVAQSFPTNSIILMEGVSDDFNLLTNKITYERMAAKLGVAEQVKEFKPIKGTMVRADIDVSEFHTNTIDLMNLIMLVHGQGAKPENVQKLLQYTPPPRFEEQLFDDLLTKRNKHVTQELTNYLATATDIMIPWGAAHMPGIAREVHKAGFKLYESRQYVAIRFPGFGPQRKRAAPIAD